MTTYYDEKYCRNKKFKLNKYKSNIVNAMNMKPYLRLKINAVGK